MGIFSIFKRKHDRSAMSAAQEDAIRIERVGEPTRQDSEAERQRQRAIARATTQKIDAIESAMAFDIFNSPEAPVTGRTLPAPGMPITDSNTLHPTLPMLELASTELQEDQCALDPALIDQSAPLIEDIAVTFANADIAGAEQMLRAALADTGRDDRALWSMLFDLLQVCHAREQFDDLSIDYASRFETSPPSWRVIASEHGVDGEVHTEVLGCELDASIAPQLDRLGTSSRAHTQLRLDVSHIRATDPDGCALLLTLLRTQPTLMVVGAGELIDLIRASLAVGRRDASDAPWLLLLQLLQLQNRETDFDETAINYCITYEVSPPSFDASAHICSACSEHEPSDRFMLPAVIEGNLDPLLAAISAYADTCEPAILDCSRLIRIDYHAAAPLLSHIRVLAAAGHHIEWRELNHLVAQLLMLLGINGVTRLFPHKT